MSKAAAFLKKELREMIPPTLFFLVVFETVVLARSLMRAGSGGGPGDDLSLTTPGAALIGALVMGKAILIADALPMFRWFRRRRAVNVAWRVLLYLVVVLFFQALEELIPLARERGLGDALGGLLDEIDWARFWATHLVLAIFLVLYAFATATIEVIGRERFRERFFGGEAGDGASEGSAS